MKKTSKQNPVNNNGETLCNVLNKYLEIRQWSPAELARKSGQSKATISRMTNYALAATTRRPSPRAVQAVSLALELNQAERKQLFYLAFPELEVWDEASNNGYDVDQTNEMLYNRGLPLLTSYKPQDIK